MIQTLRFPMILALSVVFGAPALTEMMADPDQLVRHGIAYLGALALSWLGVNLVLGLVSHYATANERARLAEEAAVQADADRQAALAEAEAAEAAATAEPVLDPAAA